MPSFKPQSNGNTLYDPRFCSIPVDKPMAVPLAPSDYMEKIESGDYLMQVKKDGIFGQLVVIDPGEIHLYTRNYDKNGFFRDVIDYFPTIRYWAKHLPPHTIIVGEIYAVGETASYMTNMLMHKPRYCLKKQMDPVNGRTIKFYIHDLLMLGWKGVKNFTYEERHKALSELYYSVSSEQQDIELAENFTGPHLYEKYKEIIASGEEGVVFKNKIGRYIAGRRDPRVLFKLKRRVDQLDCFISKIVPHDKGKNQFKDSHRKEGIWYDDMKVPQYIELSAIKDGEPFYIGRLDTMKSGLPISLAQKMLESPDNYIWQVICVRADKYEESAAKEQERLTGRKPLINHCRFGRIRTDISAQDCTLEKVMEQINA